MQFHQLATDVYDELMRKTAAIVPCLPPDSRYHPKRNQARAKLSTLGVQRFADLVTDVYQETLRRNDSEFNPPLLGQLDLNSPQLNLSELNSHDSNRSQEFNSPKSHQFSSFEMSTPKYTAALESPENDNDLALHLTDTLKSIQKENEDLIAKSAEFKRQSNQLLATAHVVLITSNNRR